MNPTSFAWPSTIAPPAHHACSPSPSAIGSTPSNGPRTRRSLYFTAPVEGDNPIFRVTLDSGSIQQVLVDRTIDSFELSPDNRRIIYTRRSVGDPVEIFAVDLADGKSSAPQRLSQFNDEVANEVDIRPAERMWVKGADGAKIEVFIVKPHDFDPAKEISAHPQCAWRAAVSVAGFLPRRLAGLSRRRLRRRFRQPPWIHGLRPGFHG